MMHSPKKTHHSNPDLTNYREMKDSTVRKRKQPDCPCFEGGCNSQDISVALRELRHELDGKLTKMNENIVSSIKADLNILNDTSLAIKNEINSLRLEHSTFKQQLTSFESSLQFTSEQQSDLKTQVDMIEKRTSSVSVMENQLYNLEMKIESLEQQARHNNIEICNLPEKRNEDLLSLMESITGAVKYPIPRQDVLSIHRVPHVRSEERSRPKNIIVKLNSRTTRNNIISAYRLCKNLNSEQIGIPGTPQRIYLNEHLTLFNKNLFRECRDMAKKHNVKYVWIKNCTIFAKQSDNSKTIVIRSPSDIPKIAQCKHIQ